MDTLITSGRVKADREFLPVLSQLGLDTLAGVFAYDGPGYQRTHANRDNFHIVHESGGRRWDLFLKRHRGFEPKELLKLMMAESPFKTAGRREWDNILRMQALGINAPRPVAVGGWRFLGFEVRSFIITERIRGGVPADDHIRERFSGGLSREMLLEKRAFLWDIGDMVRRLHRAGLTHMDLYLNHVFVHETPDGDSILYLIDLQRVARRRLFRRRWIVKDLAALIYSARNAGLSNTDIARILVAYFDGVFSPRARRLVRKAARRATRQALRSTS